MPGKAVVVGGCIGGLAKAIAVREGIVPSVCRSPVPVDLDEAPCPFPLP